MVHRTREPTAQLVTDAKRPLSEDIAFRERRYLVMMGIRVLCFLITILLFVAHAGWFSAIPAAGAILIPYFAVVFANGGREPSNTRGFRIYEPNLPDRFSDPSGPTDPWSRSATADESVTSFGDEGRKSHPDRREA
jgi:Protein of unknown function (DUF3099)